MVVNGQFAGPIVAKFMVVGGDGFQGILCSTESLFDLYYSLFEHIGYRFYIGIGTGGISTNMSENVGEMDGESFHRSSDALGKVKRKGGWVAFDSGRKIDGVITSSWNLMADVIWNWSERQKEIILDSTVYNTLSPTTRQPLHPLDTISIFRRLIKPHPNEPREPKRIP